MAALYTPPPKLGFGAENTVFIQWKGTDVCMDVFCQCGAQHHFDGDFAYAVQCGYCEQVFELDCVVAMRPVEKSDLNPWFLAPEDDE
jgi:hypothetical protein